MKSGFTFMTMSEWRNKFNPTTETPLATSGDDLAAVNRMAMTAPFNVWTVVAIGTDGPQLVLPGLHFINRSGFYITNTPFSAKSAIGAYHDE